MGLQLRPAMAPALDSSTSNMNDTSASAGERWEEVAQDLWLGKSTPLSLRPELVKSRIWDPLEAEAFSWRSLSFLEGLQILERYGSDQSCALSRRYADDG
jgi:intron-binding protein aquarius